MAMKKILLIFLVFGFASCKDFLTIVPSDAIFLEDVQSLKQALSPWLHNYANNFRNPDTDAPAPWLPAAFAGKYQAYPDVWNFSRWADKESLSDGEKRYLARAEISGVEWARHYAVIGLMNLILNEVDTAEGDDDMRNYVKGEALVHRAYSFFKLLQYYSPMDDASMGVAVHLDTYIGFPKADLSRKAQGEVFERIFADLAEAERLLGITPPRPTYNVAYNYDHIYRILAQARQWKACGPLAEPDDWRNAAEAARKAIELTDNALPWDIAELGGKAFFGDFYSSRNSGATYPEALLYKILPGLITDFGYDLETWRSLYRDDDDRKYAWFGIEQGKDPAAVQQADLDPTRKIRGFVYGNRKPQWCFRLSEQYLILIEALAHTDFDEGKRVLRLWQSVRYAGDGSGWYVPSNADALLSEVRLERKREFIYEGDMMWLDMKRYNAADAERRAVGYSAPGLTANDFRYNFRIPASETDTNPGIRRNPGWEDYEVI